MLRSTPTSGEGERRGEGAGKWEVGGARVGRGAEVGRVLNDGERRGAPGEARTAVEA